MNTKYKVIANFCRHGFDLGTIVYKHSSSPETIEPEEGVYTDGSTCWILTKRDIVEVEVDETEVKQHRPTISIAVFAKEMQGQISNFLADYINKYLEEPEDFPIELSLEEWYDKFHEWQYLTGE